MPKANTTSNSNQGKFRRALNTFGVIGIAALATSPVITSLLAGWLYKGFGAGPGFCVFTLIWTSLSVIAWSVSPRWLDRAGKGKLDEIIQKLPGLIRFIANSGSFVLAVYLGPLLAPAYYRYSGMKARAATPLYLAASVVYAVLVYLFGGSMVELVSWILTSRSA